MEVATSSGAELSVSIDIHSVSPEPAVLYLFSNEIHPDIMGARWQSKWTRWVALRSQMRARRGHEPPYDEFFL